MSSRCSQSSPRTPDPSVSRVTLSPTSLSPTSLRPVSPAAPPGLPSPQPGPAPLRSSHQSSAGRPSRKARPPLLLYLSPLSRCRYRTCSHTVGPFRLELSSVQQGLGREACRDRVDARETAGLCPQGAAVGATLQGRREPSLPRGPSPAVPTARVQGPLGPAPSHSEQCPGLGAETGTAVAAVPQPGRSLPLTAPSHPWCPRSRAGDVMMSRRGTGWGTQGWPRGLGAAAPLLTLHTAGEARHQAESHVQGETVSQEAPAQTSRSALLAETERTDSKQQKQNTHVRRKPA